MDTRVAIQIASIVHTAQLSNIDAISGKCLDVPDTPSVEPEILFPNKLPKFPSKKEDSDSSSDKEVGKKEAENRNNEKNGNNKLVVPKMNGIKRAFEETAIPSTSTVSLASSISTNCEMIIENGISQLNGIHDGIIQNGNSTKLPRVNGIHKSSKESTTASQQTVSPKQDVKAILRNSINHKQEVSSSTTTITAVATTVSGPTPSKRTRLDVNGSSSTNTSNPTNGRINGTSPSSSVSSSVAAAATNGPTTTTTSSSSSSMAIVT
uniref:Uncharacterized protein n=1 Tax=Panagrolaimus superbus TaxID=310955 RepID=A0A914Y0I8_9BILA